MKKILEQGTPKISLMKLNRPKVTSLFKGSEASETSPTKVLAECNLQRCDIILLPSKPFINLQRLAVIKINDSSIIEDGCVEELETIAQSVGNTGCSNLIEYEQSLRSLENLGGEQVNISPIRILTRQSLTEVIRSRDFLKSSFRYANSTTEIEKRKARKVLEVQKTLMKALF